MLLTRLTQLQHIPSIVERIFVSQPSRPFTSMHFTHSLLITIGGDIKQRRVTSVPRIPSTAEEFYLPEQVPQVR